MDEYKFLEITPQDNKEEMIRKSNYNLKQLQDDLLGVWHDFQCIDLTFEDSKEFTNWVIDLFLEDK